MSSVIGKKWIGLGVSAAAMIALQQCDASLLKCFCDRDRCHTPACRDLERKAPECSCRFGYYETSWSPWASNCPPQTEQAGYCGPGGRPCGNTPAAGCQNEAAPQYAPQPYVPESYVPETQPYDGQSVPYIPQHQGSVPHFAPQPGFEGQPEGSYVEPILTPPSQNPFPPQYQFPQQQPVTTPQPEVQQLFQLPGPPTVRVPAPSIPQQQLPLPPEASVQPVPLNSVPMNPVPVPVVPRATRQPIPESNSGVLPDVVPGSAGDPRNGFAPPAPMRSAIPPDGSTYFRRLPPAAVQPTTHWQQPADQSTATAQRMGHQQAQPQAAQQPRPPVAQDRWRVMPAYQGNASQQTATSRSFTVPGGTMR